MGDFKGFEDVFKFSVGIGFAMVMYWLNHKRDMARDQRQDDRAERYIRLLESGQETTRAAMQLSASHAERFDRLLGSLDLVGVARQSRMIGEKRLE